MMSARDRVRAAFKLEGIASIIALVVGSALGFAMAAAK